MAYTQVLCVAYKLLKWLVVVVDHRALKETQCFNVNWLGLFSSLR
jgi:hypothetical protein